MSNPQMEKPHSGYHFACPERIAEMGGEATCCRCSVHDCPMPPPPKCGFGPDGTVLQCLGIGCEFCDSYNEASKLFHVLKHEPKSGKGIERILAYREKVKKEQMYLDAAVLANKEQREVMERPKYGCPCVLNLGHEGCSHKGCWDAGYAYGLTEGKKDSEKTA